MIKTWNDLKGNGNHLVAGLLIVIIFLTISFFFVNPSHSFPMGDKEVCEFTEAQLSSLPENTTVSMRIVGLPIGNAINASIVFGFRYSDLTSTYSLGFYMEFLQVQNTIVFSQAVGLGYDEMREYPFAYTDNGMITDSWINRTPSWISRRPYLTWTQEQRWGGYLGPLSYENMTHLIFAGDVIEFENLTIYFQDGTSFICGPRVVTLGVNFTRSNSIWLINDIIKSSSPDGVIIEDDGLVLLLATDPVSLPLLASCILVVSVVILGCRKNRLRFKASNSNREFQGLSIKPS